MVNLRNLGIARTLVLFDGQRVVSSNIYGGGVDLSTIPADLVKRVDIVTGGASAAYGSDAVSGVVNLILDKTFTGIKGELEGSDGAPLEHRQAKVGLTWGTDFAGGKGHFILSGDHTWSNDPVFNGQPDWYNNGAIVQNPAATSTNGLPYYIHVRNTGQAQYTQGGLIRGNTAGGTGGTVGRQWPCRHPIRRCRNAGAVQLRHHRWDTCQCLLCRMYGQRAEPALCAGADRGSVYRQHVFLDMRAMS